jgi:hypothetical protein
MWKEIHVLAVAAIALRLVATWWSERISYPDELFQYLEQAHRLVYGYGFIPWEYRFGARNWLLPGTLAVLLEVLRLLGLDQPTAYVPIIKSALAILSVSIVYGCYVIGRNLFQEESGRLAAVLAAVWYELLYASNLATPEVLGAYAIVGCLALLTGELDNRKAFWAGLLLGVSVALRVQYALPGVALWVFVTIAFGWRTALCLAASGTAVLVSAGMLDAWSWGVPFISYYNNIVLNLVSGASLIFGQKPLLWYTYALSLASAGLYPIAVGYGLVTWKKCWPVLLLLACVLVPHSLVAHKEYRFVFLVTPLLLLLLADAIVSGLTQLHGNLGIRWAQPLAIALFVGTSLVGCLAQGVLKRDNRLLATLELSRRTDVSAVLDLTGNWWGSGGFYYLHRNVPYYFREQIEGLPATDIRGLVSHVLVPVGEQDIPGFRVATTYSTVVILEQVSPPSGYRRLASDGREPRQPGVDDRLTPIVRPRF